MTDTNTTTPTEADLADALTRLMLAADDVRVSAQAGDDAERPGREVSSLKAACARVMDILEPWLDGPPGESGWYEVETDDESLWYRVVLVFDGWFYRAGSDWRERIENWPAIDASPARYRSLRMGTPPERGTK